MLRSIRYNYVSFFVTLYIYILRISTLSLSSTVFKVNGVLIDFIFQKTYRIYDTHFDKRMTTCKRIPKDCFCILVNIAIMITDFTLIFLMIDIEVMS